MNPYLLLITAALSSCVMLEASWSTPIPLVPGESYRQNFDVLAPFGPKGGKALSGGTLPDGWSFLGSTPGLGLYRVDNGRRAATGYYSYGAKGAEDRALGTLQSGWGWSDTLAFGTGFENESDEVLSGLQIEFHGEEWRLGSRRASDRLVFQYSTDAHSLSSGHWVNFNLLDVKTVNLSNPGAHDGNADANRQMLSALLPLSLSGGETVWIRWLDEGRRLQDDARWRELYLGGRGAGLAIDDLSVTGVWASDVAVPEMGTMWAGGALAFLALLGWLLKDRRLRFIPRRQDG